MALVVSSSWKDLRKILELQVDRRFSEWLKVRLVVKDFENMP